MITWESRIANYARVTKYPPIYAFGPDGKLYMWWTMGNDYRVKSGFHGGYPATYLQRMKALFPEAKGQTTLHLFSGKVDTDEFPGATVDINRDLGANYVDDAQTLKRVPLRAFTHILADPVYSIEDCEHYGTTMVKRNLVMRTLGERLRHGAYIVWLDQVLPIYRKDQFQVECEIAVRKSTNHRFREVTIFRKR